jgi:hypothetical protein
MDVRMKTEILPPSVKHTHCTAFNIKMSVSKLQQGIPDSREQLTVKPFAVKQTNMVQFVRYGKDDVIMFYLHSCFQKVFHPEGLFRTLTLRTMAVSAAVVADPFFCTAIALFFVATKCSCAA